MAAAGPRAAWPPLSGGSGGAGWPHGRRRGAGSARLPPRPRTSWHGSRAAWSTWRRQARSHAQQPSCSWTGTTSVKVGSRQCWLSNFWAAELEPPQPNNKLGQQLPASAVGRRSMQPSQSSPCTLTSPLGAHAWACMRPEQHCCGAGVDTPISRQHLSPAVGALWQSLSCFTQQSVHASSNQRTPFPSEYVQLARRPEDAAGAAVGCATGGIASWDAGHAVDTSGAGVDAGQCGGCLRRQRQAGGSSG